MLGRTFQRAKMTGKLLVGAFLLTVALLSPALAQRNMVFTQFAAGGGLNCDQFFTNQSSSTVTGVVVSYFDGTGAALSVTSDLGTATSYTFDLALGETRVIRFPGTAVLKTGYVVIQTPTTSSVRATEVFRYEAGGTVLFEVGVAQQGVGPFFTFPAEVKSSAQTSTGVAVAYPTFGSTTLAAQDIVVNLVDTDGALLDSQVVNLMPGEYFSMYLPEQGLFPGLDNFTGSVCVTGTGLSVMALRQDKNGVGSVAVSTGPVLGPFVLPGAPANEAEPNDTRGQAHVLMGATLINGTISNAGGVDFFRFAGSQGDIVSFLATSQGLGGSLFPQISLQQEDGTVLAANGQAGLLTGSEAFLQVVLPATATYYLQVTDQWGGGPAGFYRLHARVPTNSGPPPPPPAPFLTSLGPAKAKQGAAFNMVIVGANLTGASSVTFDPASGIIAQITGGTDRYLEVTVNVPGGAAVGVREVKVTNPGGVSNSLNFEIISSGGTFSVDGDWTGTTSEGRAVSFTIAGGKLTQISFGAVVIGAGCTSTMTHGSSGTLGDVGNAITHTRDVGGVTSTLFGTFDSNKTASGWVKITTTDGCVGTGIATWTATRP
jgi:hypothetical protein